MTTTANRVTRTRRDQDRRARLQPQARRGRPLHPGQGQLHRRRRASRHAAHGDPAQPAAARPHQVDRHQQGLGDARRAPGADRRDDGDAQPRLDAHPVLRHPGGARHRQGALPGPGGRLRHRGRPVHRQGRVRADRGRLRAAAAHRQPVAGARAGRAGDPRRQDRPGPTTSSTTGRSATRRAPTGPSSRPTWSPSWSCTTRAATRRRSSAAAPSRTSTGPPRSSPST